MRPLRARTANDHDLTRREFDVLAAVATGKPNKDIARGLGLSEATVKSHVSKLLQKYGRPDATRTMLALWYLSIVPIAVRESTIRAAAFPTG